MSHAIRAARSTDGLHWLPDPQICVPPQGEEIATVRPTVFPSEDGSFEMYFAARGLDTPYAIRRARSLDGLAWDRCPAGIDADPAGWEGGALTYPAVFAQAGRLWMLFNGQGYGAAGFGLAVWEGA